MGWRYPPYYGKSKEFYENELKKCDKKIAQLEERKKICQEELAKSDKKDN